MNPSTIKRLQAFQDAGADVLFAPGVTQKEDIAAIVSAVDRPVNVIMGLQQAKFSVAELSALGVKRISVGSSLARLAFGAVKSAAEEILNQGTFNFSDNAMPFAALQTLMEIKK